MAYVDFDGFEPILSQTNLSQLVTVSFYTKKIMMD